MAEAYQGWLAKLYVEDPQNAGTYLEVSSVEGADLPNARGEIDVTRRGSGFRQKLVGQANSEITGTLIKDHTDNAQKVLRDAYWSAATVKVLAMDQERTTSGAEGIESTMTVREWNESQPLEDGIKIAFTLQNHPADDPAPVTGPYPTTTSAAVAAGQAVVDATGEVATDESLSVDLAGDADAGGAAE